MIGSGPGIAPNIDFLFFQISSIFDTKYFKNISFDEMLTRKRYLASALREYCRSVPGCTSVGAQVKTFLTMGRGCGAVGRAVTFNTRGPRFESSHRQLLLNMY